MGTPSVQELAQALHQSWPVSAGSKVWKDWTPDNPARGQCVPSTLVVQDYFGGDITRVSVTGKDINEMHYFNVLDDGTIIDTTRSQYTTPVTLTSAPVDLKAIYGSVREKLLADDETSKRYETLKEKVEAIISRQQ